MGILDLWTFCFILKLFSQRRRQELMKSLHTYIGRSWHGYLFAIGCMIIAIILDMAYPKITEMQKPAAVVQGALITDLHGIHFSLKPARLPHGSEASGQPS